MPMFMIWFHMLPITIAESMEISTIRNARAHDSASHVAPNYSRINAKSARYANLNTHDLASYATNNSSPINDILGVETSLDMISRIKR
jgi:hypothetical protein